MMYCSWLPWFAWLPLINIGIDPPTFCCICPGFTTIPVELPSAGRSPKDRSNDGGVCKTILRLQSWCLFQSKWTFTHEAELVTYISISSGVIVSDFHVKSKPLHHFGFQVDTCYILAFAVIMLNTSLHNPNVKDKPTTDQFVSMNRGIDDGAG